MYVSYMWGTISESKFSRKTRRMRATRECNIKMDHHEIECEVDTVGSVYHLVIYM